MLPICILFLFVSLSLANVYRMNLNKSSFIQSLSCHFTQPYGTMVLGLFSRARWKHSPSPSRHGVTWAVGTLCTEAVCGWAPALCEGHKATTPKPPGHRVSPKEPSCPIKTPLMQVSTIILGFRFLDLLDFQDFRCYSEYLHTPRFLLRR